MINGDTPPNVVPAVPNPVPAAVINGDAPAVVVPAVPKAVPAPVNSCPAIPNPVCAKPNPVQAVVAACCAAVTNGWYDPIPDVVSAVARCCKGSCPATDGAKLSVGNRLAVAAVNCVA